MIDVNYIEFFENYFEEKNKIYFMLLFHIFILFPIILLMQQILNINIQTNILDLLIFILYQLYHYINYNKNDIIIDGKNNLISMISIIIKIIL